MIDALNDVAREAGASPAAVALAWVHGRPGITSTLVGARRMDQFKDNLDALDVTLTDAQRGALDEVSAPPLNFPAHNNRTLAPVLQFAGATVDGLPSVVSPLLLASEARYSAPHPTMSQGTVPIPDTRAATPARTTPPSASILTGTGLRAPHVAGELGRR